MNELSHECSFINTCNNFLCEVLSLAASMFNATSTHLNVCTRSGNATVCLSVDRVWPMLCRPAEPMDQAPEPAPARQEVARSRDRAGSTERREKRDSRARDRPREDEWVGAG